MQSRAFLSQLSVTGDESGFFYVFSQRYEKIMMHPFSTSFYDSQPNIQ